VARVSGVPVIVTPSWLLFGVYVVLLYQPQVQERVGPTQGYVVAAALALMLLASVILHEVGHCVVARAFDLPVQSITVTLLAGRTHILKQPDTPAKEYAVAIVGPMVSLLLTSVGVAAAAACPDGSLAREIFLNLALSNGAITVLNLIPGLPLDGGRVLRSALWQVTGNEHQSVRIAARAGMVVAVLVVPLVMLVALPAAGVGSVDVALLLLAFIIGLFIFTGAYASLQQSQVAAKLPELSVASLARPALEVAATTPLAEAVRRAHEQGMRALVVVGGNGRPEGVVSEAWVRQVPAERRPWVTVADGARKLEPGLVIDAELSGEPMLEAMTSTPASEYLVEGSPARVLVSSDVAEAMSS
jgi:Zn-dependent protease/CBS domain-containing protein